MNIRLLTSVEISAAHLLAEAFLRDPAYPHIIRCQKRRRILEETVIPCSEVSNIIMCRAGAWLGEQGGTTYGTAGRHLRPPLGPLLHPPPH